jgi:hypothetical protein
MEYDRSDMVSLAVTAIAVVAFLLYVILQRASKTGDAAMADKSGFRIRLRVRISKGLTTEATSFFKCRCGEQRRHHNIRKQGGAIKQSEVDSSKCPGLRRRGGSTTFWNSFEFDSAIGGSIVALRSRYWREQTYYCGQ